MDNNQNRGGLGLGFCKTVSWRCRLKFTAPVVGRYQGEFPVVEVYRGTIAGKTWGKAMAGADVSFLCLIVGAALTGWGAVSSYVHNGRHHMA